MKNSPCILFAGSGGQRLAEAIEECSPTSSLGVIYHKQFASGEWYCQYKENIRGADVFLVQSIVHPANDNLMQLLVMADAARRASAGRITAVIPYLGYSRQDRKDKSRVPISAKLVMDILAASGIDRIVTMDLHAPQIAGFTNLPFDHLHFRPTLVDALTKSGVGIDVVVAPDVGAVKRASEIAEKWGKEFAFIAKKRTSDTQVEVTQFVGDVRGKNILIVDDLTESAGTMVAAANCCKNHGANNVYGAVTHGALSPKGLQNLQESHSKGTIDGFYCSDTATEMKSQDGCTVVSVADVFAQAIDGIHNNTSISKLFE